MTVAASHELAEAVTDPDGTTWYDPGGNEVGDVVVASTVYLNGYAVQREGSMPASYNNYLPMTPAGATAGHQVAFSLRSGGNLYEFNAANPGGKLIATNVASISDQGIDSFGQPMIDLVYRNGNAYEYHDFSTPEGKAFAASYPSLFPFTYLHSGVKQAVAGQGVSYVLLTTGQLGEYVDPNFSSNFSGFGVNPGAARNGVIASGVTSISAGTDKLGVNSVDYTSTVSGKPYLYEWRDVTGRATLLTTGVTAFSAGQHGMHAYVSGGNAYLYSESTGQVTALAKFGATATSVVLGVNATGGYEVIVVYSGGAAYQFNNSTTGSLLASNVATVSKPSGGEFRVLLTSGSAFEVDAAGDPTFWSDSGDIAIA
jgi:hypothetical protein